MRKEQAGNPIFRCRKCGDLTGEPIEHVLDAHPDLPSTMAQVWYGFALVGRGGAVPPELPGQEPLPV